MAGTPSIQENIPLASAEPKKRSGSGDNDNKKLSKWANYKLGKGKGRNRVKIGQSSTTNLHRIDTLELKKNRIFIASKLRNSPKFLENKLKVKKKNLKE